MIVYLQSRHPKNSRRWVLSGSSFETPRTVTLLVVEKLCWARFGQGTTYTAECARCLAACNAEVSYCLLFLMLLKSLYVCEWKIYSHPGVNRLRNWSIPKRTLNLNIEIVSYSFQSRIAKWILPMHTWHVSCHTCVYAHVCICICMHLYMACCFCLDQ